MKKIEAVIQPSKVAAMKHALADIGIHGITVTNVNGVGRQEGWTASYRGIEYAVDLVSKRKVEIIVSDEKWRQVVEVIQVAAKSGRIEDGEVCVFPCEDVIRIQTGEISVAAL